MLEFVLWVGTRLNSTIWSCIFCFFAAHGKTLSVGRVPKHLLLCGGQKPTDLLIQKFSEGFHALAFDASLSDTLQSTCLDNATIDIGYVVAAAHDRETRTYPNVCLEVNLAFFAMVWESIGETTRTIHFMVESWSSQ